MKKYLLLFTGLLLIVLVACNDTESKKEIANSDSTVTDSVNTDTLSPPIDIKKYLINKSTFDSIRNNNSNATHNPKTIDSSLKQYLATAHPTGIVSSEKGKYRNQDTLRYALTRGFQPGSDSARVKNYKTVLFKVFVPKQNTIEGDTYYYDVVLIKPPPPEL